ncbi:MAG: alpha-1,2-fucosyltransferase, partial [bacterium]
MLVTELYKGQGLGNQLWCYVTTRVIALNKGYDFGIKSPENFKGMDFIDLDFGKPVIGGKGPDGGAPLTLPEGIKHYYFEWSVIHKSSKSDIRTADKNLLNIPDNTKIDGCLQDVEYIKERKNEIRKWLKVREEYECYDFSHDNICIMNFRGGTYAKDKDFFLPKSYWENAMNHMRKINNKFKFVVITDDVKTAKKFFPDLDVFHFSIAKDYVIIKNAKYLILSNSSFAWFPAWLNENLKFCIAPKYWARHNISDGYWSLGYNITDGWWYEDRDGKLQDYNSCVNEFNEYLKKNKESFISETKYNALENYIYTKEKETPAPLSNIILQKINNLRSFFGTTRRNTSNFNALVQLLFLPIKAFSSGIENHLKTLFRNDAKIISLIKVIKSKMFEETKKIYFILIENTLYRIKESRTKRDWLSPNEIKKYRKNIKIYDIFNFFNELDLLEIRLSILDKYVDYFVIVEAVQTFSGDPKPLYYKENEQRYKKWKDKIIHYVINDVPANEDDLRSRLYNKDLSPLEKEIITNTLTSDNIDRSVVHWLKEFYIKECPKKAIANLDDNDICYISDLDEIWNPKLLVDYSKDNVFKPIQLGYQYYLNNRTDENHWTGWTGTVITKFKNIKHTSINHIRT